ncbi:hypothetical protein [Corynebacterium uterequi]|uniref:Uncharacterized protein n=1 Tax=Corynebacterium uterequi TaxID=1072256 RepID=A0A0G3HCE2_9CORY|nr:hypothetical protein [Corynebacterium uterequi]AKK10360.1 hypothetical protein CUTER_01720 [Corynebacterium uterequi]
MATTAQDRTPSAFRRRFSRIAIGLGLLTQTILVALFFSGHAGHVGLMGAVGIAAGLLAATGALASTRPGLKGALTVVSGLAAVGWWRYVNIWLYPGDGTGLDPTLLIAPLTTGASIMIAVVAFLPRPRRPYAAAFVLLAVACEVPLLVPGTSASDLSFFGMVALPFVAIAQVVVALRCTDYRRRCVAVLSGIGGTLVFLYSLVLWGVAPVGFAGLSVTVLAAVLEAWPARREQSSPAAGRVDAS